MSKNGEQERKDKQRTKKGAEIPVPKRSAFMKNLRKVAKLPPRPRPKK